MFLIRLIINALALLGIAYFVPGIRVSSFGIAFIAAILIGALNTVIKPIFAILTFPVTLVTFGLSALIVNVVVFWFVASFVDGFSVSGFVPAATGALLLWLASFFSGMFLKR